MADIKITDLAAYTDPVSTDVLPIVDIGNDLTKKVSIANLAKNAGVGSAASPSISFDGDNDTGIYQPGVNQIAITTGGTQRLLVDSSGSATFAGDIKIGGLPSAPNITLKADGSAEFATSIQVAGNGAAGTEVGLVIGAGSINATRALGSNSNVFRGYSTGNSTPTSRIASDGSAEFAGDITCSDNSKGLVLKSPNGTSFRLSVANDGTLSASAA